MTNQVERLNQALAGRYRVARQIGRDGWMVYLAHDLQHHREVSLFVTVPASAVGAERFLREMALIARLDHPHILPLLDSGHAGEFLYYVVPHQGGSLRDRLRREKQLPVHDALQITRQVAEALTYAQSHGVVHGDIKPENILLAGGHARVADFGWTAQSLPAAGETPTELGLSIGTPEYMSPERATSAGDVGHRSDVYSLAAVLYEMLIGNPPFVASDARAVLARVIGEIPTPVRRLRSDVPAAVEAALSCALAKLPADRFATALAFAEALEPDGTVGPL
jgi:serine/threonine-protein kinase